MKGKINLKFDTSEMKLAEIKTIYAATELMANKNPDDQGLQSILKELEIEIFVRQTRQTYTYQAYTGQNGHILTVIATNSEDATKQIYDQLDRPGRKEILNTWLDGGAKLRIIED